MKVIDFLDLPDLLGMPLTVLPIPGSEGPSNYWRCEGEVQMTVPFAPGLGMGPLQLKAKVIDSLLSKDAYVSSYVAVFVSGSMILVFLKDVRDLGGPVATYRLLVLDASLVHIPQNGGALTGGIGWTRKEFYERVAVGIRAEYRLAHRSATAWEFVPRARLRYYAMRDARRKGYSSKDADMIGDILAASDMTVEDVMSIPPGGLPGALAKARGLAV